MFKEKSLYLFTGERVFSNETERGITEWIILCPDPKAMRDEFTIEVEWSSKDRFPELGMRPSILDPHEAIDQKLEEYVGRLSRFWSKIDPWWKIESTEEIDQQILDAISQIENYWIPFADKIITSQSR